MPSLAGLFLALALLVPATPADADAAKGAPGPPLRLIGQQAFDDQTVIFDGTVPGGLSGLESVPAAGHYLAISDDPATPERGGARFYTLELDFGADGFDGYRFTSVTELLGADGAPFPEGGVDPESIRLLPSGNLLWTSEGFERTGIDPFVRETTPGGAYVRDLRIPDRFDPTPDEATGSRHNLVFESLTLTPDGRHAVIAAEGALRQDGPMASAEDGSPSRVLVLDLESGGPGAEYVYFNDPIADAADGFSLNGLVELLALADQRFLALERSYSEGVGHGARLYLFDVSAATDVSGFDSLAGAEYDAGEKTLLVDLARYGVELHNLEGLTFGPTLENGHRSLVLVSDDNFDGVTQFLVFEVRPGVLP